MSKTLQLKSSPTKPEEAYYEDDEENFVDSNNDDYEKETKPVPNYTTNTDKKDSANNNNANNTHNAIKQRLLKMEAETKKITQMQNEHENMMKNKYNNDNSHNENDNDNDNIDNENEEVIELCSNSSNNNYNFENEEPQLTSPTHKSKTSNANATPNSVTNPTVIKTTEITDENGMVEYPSIEDQKMMDERSIFVNNLHTDTTASELQQLFATCGTIERITIVCDKWTGRPKGCSYIQFKSKESIDSALVLHGREVKGQIISVEQKRTNLPKWLRGRGRGRVRGTIGRGRVGRAYFMPPYFGPPPMMPMSHPYGYFRGRGYRSRGYWQPY
jgi:RNA recognition motif-containing protein